MQHLILYNQQLLGQLDQLLLQLDDQLYCQANSYLLGSTVGQHVRHMIEFYQCFFLGLPAGQLSYDDRKRDLTLEMDISTAHEVTAQLIEQLNFVTTDKPLELGSRLATASNLVIQPTSVMRELMALADHTVHHLAIVRMAIMVMNSQVCFEPDFGVATATIQHKNNA